MFINRTSELGYLTTNKLKLQRCTHTQETWQQLFLDKTITTINETPP